MSQKFWPESDPGPQVCQQAPQHIPQQQYLPPGADHVGREDSACQKQFNPGDETYRCIDCEITDDTPGIEFIYFIFSQKWNHRPKYCHSRLLDRVVS